MAVAGAIGVARALPCEMVTNGGGCELSAVNCCGCVEAVVAFTIASLAVFVLFVGGADADVFIGSGVKVAADVAVCGEFEFTADNGGG